MLSVYTVFGKLHGCTKIHSWLLQTMTNLCRSTLPVACVNYVHFCCSYKNQFIAIYIYNRKLFDEYFKSNKCFQIKQMQDKQHAARLTFGKIASVHDQVGDCSCPQMTRLSVLKQEFIVSVRTLKSELQRCGLLAAVASAS